ESNARFVFPAVITAIIVFVVSGALTGTVKLAERRLGRSRVGRVNGRMMTPRDPIYAGHRYSAEIISYAVWLYFRFPLTLRMVEEMLAARGISVTHETIRQWSLKFGREFANRIRQRAPRARAARRGGACDRRAGRNAVYQLTALTIGARLAAARTEDPARPPT